MKKKEKRKPSQKPNTHTSIAKTLIVFFIDKYIHRLSHHRFFFFIRCLILFFIL